MIFYDQIIINNEITATYTKLQENSIKSHNQYVEATSSTNDVCSLERKYIINSNEGNVDIRKPFRVFHRNIKHLKGKRDELGLHFLEGTHQVICLMEHHLKDYETDNVCIPKYKLGAKYCRLHLKNGGVCIYILDSLTYDNTDLTKYSKDQDLEICGIKLVSMKKFNHILFI